MSNVKTFTRPPSIDAGGAMSYNHCARCGRRSPYFVVRSFAHYDELVAANAADADAHRDECEASQ